MSSWEIYDQLIDGIESTETIERCAAASDWTCVQTQTNLGVVMTVRGTSRPRLMSENMIGKPLKEAAQLVKSWNFIEASLGMAAINAYYNRREFLTPLPGFKTKPLKNKTLAERKKQEAFIAFADEVKGKKVGIIGHFPFIEQQYGPLCELSIFEQQPQDGDFLASASEYLLAEQDFAFITGVTLTNKTLPRLFEVSKGKVKVAMVGPSVPMSPILADHGANNLSGFLAIEQDELFEAVAQGRQMEIFNFGQMVSLDL